MQMRVLGLGVHPLFLKGIEGCVSASSAPIFEASASLKIWITIFQWEFGASSLPADAVAASSPSLFVSITNSAHLESQNFVYTLHLLTSFRVIVCLIVLGKLKQTGQDSKKPVRLETSISSIISRTGQYPSAASLTGGPESLLGPRQQWQSRVLHRNGPTGSTRE